MMKRTKNSDKMKSTGTSRLFAPGLYRDQLARCRTAALVCAALLLAAALIAFGVDIHDRVGRFLYRAPDGIQYYAAEPFSPEDELVRVEADTNALEFLFALIPLPVPVFVFSAFAFLCSRRENDYLLALPYTKKQLFFTCAAAVLTLPVLAAAGLCLLEGLLYAIMPGMTVSVSALCRLGGASLLSSCVLAASALLAVSLTGTRFSALLTFVCLTVWPALLRRLMSETLRLLLGHLVRSERLPALLCDPCVSAPWWLAERAVSFGDPEDVTINGGRILSSTSFGTMAVWSAAVALLLGFAAYLAFIRRSDCVGAPAISRPVQHGLRVLAVLPLAAAVVTIAERAAQRYFLSRAYYDGALREEQVTRYDVSDDVRGMIYLAVVTVAVYFMAEAVTVRSPRTLLRAAPAFAAVALFGLAFWGTAEATAAVCLNFCPADDRVAEVRIDLGAYRNDVRTRDFCIAASVAETDPAQIAKVTGGLRRMQSSERAWLKLTRHGTPVSEGEIDFSTSESVAIRLRSGVTLYRNVRYDPDPTQNFGFLGLFTDDPAVAARLLELPPVDEVTFVSLMVDNQSWGIGVGGGNVLYRTFLAEYEAMDDETKMLVRSEMRSRPAGSGSTEACRMTVEGSYEGLRYSETYWITSARMPKTWKLIRSHSWES